MENEVQQVIPSVKPLPQNQTSVPNPRPTNWLRILLFTVLGIAVIAGSVLAGIQIGKSQTSNQQSVVIQPNISPTQVAVNPTGLSVTPSPTTDPTVDWKTYINNNFGFSVKYNPAFNPNEVANSIQKLALISFGSMKNNGFDIEVTTGDSIDYYKNQITDQGEKIDKEEKISVDGITATKLTYKQIIVIDKYDVSKVIVTNSNRDYIITALASDITQIISTFKFTN